MANPQTENGYTPIANETLEALCRVNLSPYESRVLLFIIRKTYGWRKKSDMIPNRQIAKGCHLDRRHVHRALKSLKLRSIVISIDDKLGFNKDYDLWVGLSPVEAPGVILEDDSLSSVEAPSKENNKRKKEKNNGTPYSPPKKGDKKGGSRRKRDNTFLFECTECGWEKDIYCSDPMTRSVNDICYGDCNTNKTFRRARPC